MSLLVLGENLAKMAVGPFRERGLVETLHSIRVTAGAIRSEREEGFDRRFGTDTERRLTIESLLAKGDDVMPLWRYFATLERTFSRVMAALEIGEKHRTFVDLGCGKGRVLLMASELPFRRIIGVELSPALVEVARRNISIYRSATQQCHRFQLIERDAAKWAPPVEDLVLYLFQPFPLDAMAAMMTNLERSLERNPRAVTIVYNNPLFGDVVTKSGRFACRREGEAERVGEFRWAIFSNVP